jgi:hypothetical protein
LSKADLNQPFLCDHKYPGSRHVKCGATLDFLYNKQGRVVHTRERRKLGTRTDPAVSHLSCATTRHDTRGPDCASLAHLTFDAFRLVSCNPRTLVAHHPSTAITPSFMSILKTHNDLRSQTPPSVIWRTYDSVLIHQQTVFIPWSSPLSSCPSMQDVARIPARVVLICVQTRIHLPLSAVNGYRCYYDPRNTQGRSVTVRPSCACALSLVAC